jgi:ParB family chromosome partitioning protein
MKNENKGRTLKDLLYEHKVDEIVEGESIEEIDLLEIKPNPYQPRRLFDDNKISELAESIKEYGIFQPVILKKVKQGYYIVSGERRYRAAQRLGLKTIPSIIRQYEESKVAEIALAENLQRENLTPIEEAEAYRNILNNLQITQNELAQKIGKSRSHVTNMLGLLNLPNIVQSYILSGQISMGHARVLSKLQDDQKIIKIAKSIIEKDLSVRFIEQLTAKEEKAKKVSRIKTNVYHERESELAVTLGTKVKIDGSKIVIYVDEKSINQMIEKLLKT